jgi:hypothetical protein
VYFDQILDGSAINGLGVTFLIQGSLLITEQCLKK